MDISRALNLRPGGARDIPAVLGLFDGAMDWLVSQGRTGQWGTESWSGQRSTVSLVEGYFAKGSPWIAELDGAVVGTVTLTDGPGPYLAPAGEPERYVHLLASERRLAGQGIGATLLAHCAAETRRAGVSLLRVDCYAGGDGKLVDFYTSCGFTRAQTFTEGPSQWPGQVLEMRVN